MTDEQKQLQKILESPNPPGNLIALIVKNILQIPGLVAELRRLNSPEINKTLRNSNVINEPEQPSTPKPRSPYDTTPRP